MKRHETPVRRVNPSGKVVWLARYTNWEGVKKSAGTFDRKREAQDAIHAAYDTPGMAVAPGTPVTLGAVTVRSYAVVWHTRYPRSERTDATNSGRIRAVLDVPVEGVPFGDWPMNAVRPRHLYELVGAMLTDQGRAVSGCQNILRSLSAMFTDAWRKDELPGLELNPVAGVEVRKNDPRCTKAPKGKRVYTFDQMHGFATAATVVDAEPVEWVQGAARQHAEQWATWKRVYAEAMIRALADCGLRLGQLFGLHRQDFDGEFFHVRGSAYNGRFVEGDQPTKKHVRSVPVPPTLAELIRAIPPRIDTPILFPTQTGCIWRKDNFYKRVWNPTRSRVEGMGVATPQEFRASWESNLRAQRVDEADLAAVAGHSLTVANAHYVQALNRSASAIRKAIG